MISCRPCHHQQVAHPFLFFEQGIANLRRQLVGHAGFGDAVVTVDARNLFDDIRLAGNALADIQAVVGSNGGDGFTAQRHLEFQTAQQAGDIFSRKVNAQPALHIAAA